MGCLAASSREVWPLANRGVLPPTNTSECPGLRAVLAHSSWTSAERQEPFHEVGVGGSVVEPDREARGEGS